MKSKTRNTPALRFSEFSDGWSENDLGNVAEVTTGNKDTQDSVINGKYPFVVRSQTLERIDTFSYSGEAILTSGDGVGVGKNFHYINGKFDFHQRVYCLRNFADGLSGKFLFFYFSEKFNRRVMRMSAKNSVDSVRRDMIVKMPIMFPSLTEQQKIAAFLSAVDEKIDQLTQKKGLLLKYKKGVMQKIFSREIRFKDDHGADYPDWGESPIGTLCKIYDGTHMTPDYQPSGVPFYSVENVTSNDFSNTKYIGEEVYEQEKKRVAIEKGDILMTRIGDIGTSKYISWDAKASFYVSLALIKASPKIDSEYLNQFIKSDLFQRELHRRTLHVAFPKKINLGEISECEVLVPVREEQRQIAIFLSAIDKWIELVDAQLTKMKIFKKGLLQQMFV